MGTPQYVAAPNNSRYIPFTQQAFCCVPTSVQMIMYKNGIPLVPAEELGYRLGLTVPPDAAELFYKPRASKQPPTAAGYGTQVLNPEYGFEKVFKEMGIPLMADLLFERDIPDEQNLIDRLQKIEKENTDALLCFDHGTIRVDGTHNGHVVVFDRIIDGKIRIVDPSSKHPKWRLVEPTLMLEAMRNHPLEGTGGIWEFQPTD